MATEVKRTNWSRFCRTFNSTNQYRPVTVRVKHRGTDEMQVSQNDPLMGIVLTKRGRLIDGIDLFTAQSDPHKLHEPTISIRQPVKITLDKDRESRDAWLSVESKDGTRVTVSLSGEGDSGQLRGYVERIAYNFYEQRGYQPGHDLEDWLEAERLIAKTASSLT